MPRHLSILAALLLSAAPALAALDDGWSLAWGGSEKAYASFRDSPLGMGGLLTHQAVVAPSDVKVYRLYDDRAPTNSKYTAARGGYWTLSTVGNLPICKAFNNRKRLAVCTLPKYSVVLRGRSQSLDCAKFPGSGSTDKLPGEDKNLIFLNDPKILKNCTDKKTNW